MKRGDLIRYRIMNIWGEDISQYGIILNEACPKYFNALMQCGEIKMIEDHYIELLMRTIT